MKTIANLYEELSKASPFFQRSINLKYDLSTSEYINFYIPTTKSVEALKEIASSCLNEHNQRAHIFVGPYGVGKSIFTVVLAGLLSRNNNINEAVFEFIKKIKNEYTQLSTDILKLYESGKKYLPVVLSGDEGPLEFALARGLLQALQREGINDIKPHTIFSAVKQTILMWQGNYPEVYRELESVLKKNRSININQFIDKIDRLDIDAYSMFLKIYPQLTAGSQFNFTYKQSPIELYKQVASEISSYKYSGIFVLYDEFGRFLEGRIGQPFGAEAQLLQDFAEYCNRTSEPVVHLIAITHRVMSQYAQGLPGDVRLEWQRIEGRFKTLSLIGDSRISYTLIGKALQSLNKAACDIYLNKDTNLVFMGIMSRTVELGIFDLSTDETLDVLRTVYPLHPVTLFCLPELSEKVAQNERTIFTFLFGKDPYSLDDLLKRNFIQNSKALPFIYIDHLYDYFKEPMRADNTPGGVHETWSFAEGALKLIPDKKSIARRIVKALAIIHAVNKGSANRPNNELLTLALGYDENFSEYSEGIDYLVAKKIIIFRATSNCWEFVQRSDVDVIKEIEAVLDEISPNERILKTALDKFFKSIYFPARKYIDEYGTIRYFTGVYFTVDEVCNINDWNGYLEKFETADGKKNGYADGIVAFILAADQSQKQRAVEYVRFQNEPRVIFVIPECPIKIYHPLKEMFALNILQNRPSLKDVDPRVEKELEFLIDDSKERVRALLNQITDPSAKGVWYNQGNKIDVRSYSAVCKYVSRICTVCFSNTPPIFSEPLNRKAPSVQQIKASQKVIDSLLQDELSPGLGLIGSGPDVAIYKMVLKANDIIAETGNNIEIKRPEDEKFALLWDTIYEYLTSSAHEEITFAPLIDKLQKPPWGLRRGIIPILISPVIARHLSSITVTLRGKPLSPLTGVYFTEIVKSPDNYGILYNSPEPYAIRLYDTLEKLFTDDYRGYKNRKQPLYFITQCMEKWLLSLPNYCRSSTRYLPDTTKLFRDIIRKCKMDPYVELMSNLPNVLKIDDETPSEVIEDLVINHIGVLIGAVNELKRKVRDRLLSVFGLGGDNVSDAANNWMNNIILEPNKDMKNHIIGDVYCSTLMKYCHNSELEETEWISGLAKEITGLDLDYWTDQTEDMFIKMIDEAKERIEREYFQLNETPNSGIIKVTFGPDNNQINFSFKENSLSESAQRLLANVKRTIDNTGHELNYDERMELGLELLKHLTKI